MKLVGALCVLTAAAVVPSQAEIISGVVNWKDTTLEQARQSPPLINGKESGFESSGGTNELLKSKLPVLGLLPSELNRVFDDAGIKLESDNQQQADVDLSNVQPSAISTDDGDGYNIQYDIIDGVILTMTGTRKIDNSLDVEDSTLPEVSIVLASQDVNPLQSILQYSRFGQVLYTVTVDCAAVDLISYCQSEQILMQAKSLSDVLFVGNEG
ncbi:hypothetical protein [Mesorhizobium sp.]|uniref:hypothetical protein n=1 Tax=Mesorhizobium sp. TaxID=1871066 RepID=UPI000FE68AEE|nr:hypothetical protein [Mesorhizobium sp.]RWN24287.1 MAG: hypothetical protein EOR95_33510 [Mesorhizobium sp.]